MVLHKVEICFCSQTLYIAQQQYDQNKDMLPVQRGNVGFYDIDFLNAVPYTADNGCLRQNQSEKKSDDGAPSTGLCTARPTMVYGLVTLRHYNRYALAPFTKAC